MSRARCAERGMTAFKAQRVCDIGQQIRVSSVAEIEARKEEELGCTVRVRGIDCKAAKKG